MHLAADASFAEDRIVTDGTRGRGLRVGPRPKKHETNSGQQPHHGSTQIVSPSGVLIPEAESRKSLTERCQRPGLLKLHQALRRFGPLFEQVLRRSATPGA